MPKLIAPDGRTVSVSKVGREALLARGYSELDAASAPAPAPEPVPARTPEPAPASDFDVDAATKDELIEHAEANGIEVTRSAKVDEVREQVRAGLKG